MRRKGAICLIGQMKIWSYRGPKPLKTGSTTIKERCKFDGLFNSIFSDFAGNFCGRGFYVDMQNNTFYIGQFLNNNPEGEGKLITDKLVVYEGEFSEGKLVEGRMTEHAKDKVKEMQKIDFEGFFKDQFPTLGVMTFKRVVQEEDGQKRRCMYNGQFSNDRSKFFFETEQG
jgi:hypothetical protein